MNKKLKSELKKDVKRMYDKRNEKGYRGKRYFNLENGASIVKLTPGKKALDIIPFYHGTNLFKRVDGKEKGDLSFMLDISVHSYFEGNKDSVICPMDTFGEPCPICKKRKELMNENYEKNKDRAYALKPQQRVLMNVINLRSDEEDENNGQVQILNESYKLFAKELFEEAGSVEDDGGPADFVSPDKDGSSVLFRSSPVVNGPFKYNEYKSFRFEERDEGYDERIMEEDYKDKFFTHGAFQLDTMLNVLSYDELESLLYTGEVDEEEEEDDEDEEEDEPKAPSRASKEKPVEKDEEEEDKPDTCPYGHTFGEDNMETDDCVTCRKEHPETFKQCVYNN